MYFELQKRLAGHLRDALKRKYDLTVENIPVEIPPDLKFGELATPLALQLARTLRKAPKIIAQEIVAELGTVDGFAGFEVAGAGYINARMDRGAVARAIAAGEESAQAAGGHVLVEHTSINPNKAAHIGHLRNAILGDTFVRLLRAAGNKVDVQNYIDNTGVQVADVVVGFLHLEKKSVAEIRALVADCEKRAAGADGHTAGIDYYCWDTYTRVGQWYSSGTDEESTQRKKLRYDTLHQIEHGGNETAEVAELISTAVLRRHLETMLRLDIEYDFLPRESEILHLKFWEKAFELLKQTGVLYFETEGKNKGCWVMRRPGAEIAEGETDEDAKVIVRSNGTVTYVGKDIAYHLWKFGLLGRDFGYKPFFNYADRECWISTEHGVEPHPHFGGATAIYNVIDSRQADPQANVIQALRGMGHTAQADNYTHFGYEMVALTPSYAAQLGYALTDEDRARPYIEISGRKGFGVKADDLMDLMIEAAKAEVVKRHADWSAEQIDVGCREDRLRSAALLHAAVQPQLGDCLRSGHGSFARGRDRTVSHVRRGAHSQHLPQGGDDAGSGVSGAGGVSGVGRLSRRDENEDIWALWLRAGQRTLVLEQCIATSEPMHLAKHAFQLAQDFSNFYHHHHILTEEDPAKKTFLLATAAVALREMVTVLSWLGIESPEAM